MRAPAHAPSRTTNGTGRVRAQARNELVADVALDAHALCVDAENVCAALYGRTRQAPALARLPCWQGRLVGSDYAPPGRAGQTRRGGPDGPAAAAQGQGCPAWEGPGMGRLASAVGARTAHARPRRSSLGDVPVGRHEHLDVAARVEPVQLVDQLEHRPLHLVVTAGAVVEAPRFWISFHKRDSCW